MSQKYRVSQEQYYNPTESHYSSFDQGHFKMPIKSPSPDKKSSNIIVSTKSPEITQIKRQHYTPDKQILYTSWYNNRESAKQKPFSLNTPNKNERDQVTYTIQETIATSNKPSSGEYKRATDQAKYTTGQAKYFSSASSSRVRNTKIQIVASNTPEDFEHQQDSSRVRINRSESMEMDYLRLLKSKEDTIKELKDIIELIKRNNNNTQEGEQQQTIKDLKWRNHELNSEVKQLKIQNQHLLNVIQKSKHSTSSVKQQILHREIRQLRDTLREKELQIQDISINYQKTIHHQRQQISRLENENQSLLRLLKQKQDNLGNSSLSVQSKSSDKERLSLIKIKEQHQQNMRLLQENILRQIQQLQRAYHYQLEQLIKRIEALNKKVSELQHTKNQIQRRLPEFDVNMNVRQQFHREKQRHQQIQSVFLQKNNLYERELSQQKKSNERLIIQLSKATRQIQQLQNRSQSYQMELNQIKQRKVDDELALANKERNSLIDQIEIMNKQNTRLKNQFEQFAFQKNGQISELQKKIQLIMLQYETHTRQERKNFSIDISIREQQLRKAVNKEKQILDYYQKDKMDTQQKVKQAIDLYNKQNQGLKMSISQKNNQIYSLTQQLGRLKTQYLKHSEQSISQQQLKRVQTQYSELRMRFLSLQKQVEKLKEQLIVLNYKIQEKDQHILQLQKRLASVQQQKIATSKNLAQEQIKNDDLTVRISRKQRECIDYQKRIQYLQKLIHEKEQENFVQISGYKKELLQQEQKNGALLSKIYEKQQEVDSKSVEIAHLRATIDQKQKNLITFNQYDYMEEQLKELKRIVCQYFSNNASKSQSEIVEQFYKLNYNYEIKLQENLRLLKEAQQLKTEMAAKLRQKGMLEQKVTLLQNNIVIYERQLKERRLLYEQLLQQKIRIQKQVLLSKKIKIEQSQLENNYRSNISEITSRIDRLVDIQQQRSQNMKGLLLVREQTI